MRARSDWSSLGHKEAPFGAPILDLPVFVGGCRGHEDIRPHLVGEGFPELDPDLSDLLGLKGLPLHVLGNLEYVQLHA